MSNVSDLLKSFQGNAADVLGASGAEIVFRSQVTPELRIDVGQSFQPSYAPVSNDQGMFSSLVNQFMRDVVKPEIEVRSPGLGINRVVPLYGASNRPERNLVPWIVGVGALAVIGAGAILYTVVKKK